MQIFFLKGTGEARCLDNWRERAGSSTPRRRRNAGDAPENLYLKLGDVRQHGYMCKGGTHPGKHEKRIPIFDAGIKKEGREGVALRNHQDRISRVPCRRRQEWNREKSVSFVRNRSGSAEDIVRLDKNKKIASSPEKKSMIFYTRSRPRYYEIFTLSRHVPGNDFRPPIAGLVELQQPVGQVVELGGFGALLGRLNIVDTCFFF